MPEEFAEQTETVEETSVETDFTEEVKEESVEVETDFTDVDTPAPEVSEEFKAKDDDKDDSDDDDSDDADDDDDDDDKKPASNHSLEEYEALENEISSLRAEIEVLREFKLNVENEQKDALMASFPYNTLSEEDTRDVIEHKAEYSLDEIKSKLAVIYIEKGVQFAAAQEEAEQAEEDEEAITTFSLDGEVTGPISELQEALHRTKQM